MTKASFIRESSRTKDALNREAPKGAVRQIVGMPRLGLLEKVLGFAHFG
jgi:hypothetical protein